MALREGLDGLELGIDRHHLGAVEWEAIRVILHVSIDRFDNGVFEGALAFCVRIRVQTPGISNRWVVVSGRRKDGVSALPLSSKQQDKSISFPFLARSLEWFLSGAECSVPERATAWFSPRPYDVVSPDVVSWHHLGVSSFEFRVSRRNKDGRLLTNVCSFEA